jgi:CDP-glycerol glycerophosphotransferase (TagB/SpsB family)
VNFNVDKIVTYVPTHRDYENPEREFFDSNKSTSRSIWGHVTREDLEKLEKTLIETNTLIIAKVHPVQQATTRIISKESSSHIIFYSDLVKRIKTSLNPLLAISDSIITDYTTAVYDFLYMNRPIIYYFYDIELYRATRGFFIEPIESICAGHLTYSLPDLCNAIVDLKKGNDPYAAKRQFLQEIFIRHLDGCSTERIKKFFFN